MRSIKTLFAAGLMLACLPGAAHAQWYVGADGGVALSSTSSANNGGPTTSFNPGWLADGQVGYSFGAPKAEFELGYRQNDVNQVNGGPGSGTVGALDMMINGIYDFNENGTWHPFLGAGIGAAHVVANDVNPNNANGYTGGDWKFAYQGMAGVGYDITSNLMAKAQYRFFETQDYGVTFANGGTGSAGYKSQSILVGLTYKFGAPAPAQVSEAPVSQPAPQPAPAPAPAPVAAPVHNYMVFFDFNKADLTPDAERIVNEAAASITKGHIARVDVIGHTDLAGSVKYNQELSLRRAEAVKAALVRDGVPADEITVAGKGKSDPLVPTKDGVREPQNRRVEILLQ